MELSHVPHTTMKRMRIVISQEIWEEMKMLSIFSASEVFYSLDFQFLWTETTLSLFQHNTNNNCSGM